MHFFSFFFPRLKKVKITQHPKIYSNYSILRDGFKVKSKLIYNKKGKYFFITCHGLNGNLNDFFHFSQLVQKNGYSCLNWTFRSWNFISQPASEYHLHTLVNDIYDLVKATQKQFSTHKIVLVGHSLGGMLLTELIAKYPKLSNNIRLILINYPTKNILFKDLKNFFSFKLKGIGKILKGFLWNKSTTIHLFPRSSVMEKRLSGNQFVPSTNWTFPFYFFIDTKKLIRRILFNLKSNKKNQILITLAENEIFADKKKIFFQKKSLKKHSNIRFWIRHADIHHFPNNSRIRNVFFQKLINQIIEKDL